MTNNQQWIDRWHQNKIGFHQSQINVYLQKYFDDFSCSSNSVFIPLCGKSSDILYLSKKVNKVIGVELVQKAIDDFISENNLQSSVSNQDNFIKYNIDNIDIFAGDIFDFNIHSSDKIDIFDRASLVALDKNTRKIYAKKILKILSGSMLLVTLEFGDPNRKGPPWSVSEEEIFSLYSHECSIELLDSIDLNSSNDNMSGFDVVEKIFLIKKSI